MSFEECVRLGRDAIKLDNDTQAAIIAFRKAWDELKNDSQNPEKLKEEVWAAMIAPS